MKVFRASYSTLSVWARGDYDLAIGMYFKRVEMDTPAMREGREYHTRFEHEIKSTGHMPAIFGGGKLPADYRCEVFASKQLANWLVLRGKLDLKLPTVGYDWKTGITPSTQWANSFQHKVYKVLYPELERFEYHAFNQYAKPSEAVTVSIVHLTPKSLEEGVEWVVTHASDMKQYIEANNLEMELARG